MLFILKNILQIEEGTRKVSMVWMGFLSQTKVAVCAIAHWCISPMLEVDVRSMQCIDATLLSPDSRQCPLHGMQCLYSELNSSAKTSFRKSSTTMVQPKLHIGRLWYSRSSPATYVQYQRRRSRQPQRRSFGRCLAFEAHHPLGVLLRLSPCHRPPASFRPSPAPSRAPHPRP
jgi:hypothetical protein